MSKIAQPPQQLIACLPAWPHAVTLELVRLSGNPLKGGGSCLDLDPQGNEILFFR